ncbi:50S ribosomal protein L21 [Murdochiella vaginalis]|uniref:50S ribosomal protein L21 n=1 Tax=Murdochiella vaginalis TaxID=1852373 RepID=UPI0008FE0D48|nr:50S ribosomal protein L21 [Murdochiella vaginalis]
MYAVLETGGKQFQVQVGDQIKVEKLAGEVGESIAIDKVLMLGGDALKVGKPYIEGASVKATVVAQGKDKKIVIGKFRPKSGYRRTRGHRQPYTLLKIEAINA